MPDEGSGTLRFVPYRKRPPRHAPRIKTYDFRRPDKFSMQQIRTLALIHGTFARRASTNLSARLGANATVTERFVDQVAFGEFLESSKESDAFLIVKFDPVPGSAIFRFGTPFVASLVSRLAGGPVNDVSEHSDPTDLDAEIMRVSSDTLLRSLSAAWSEVLDLEARFGSFEKDRKYATIVPPGEMILLAGLEIEIDGVKNGFEIAYPALMLEPLVSRLSFGSWKQPEAGNVAPVDTGRIPLEGSLYYETEPIPLRELPNILNGRAVKLAFPWEAVGEAGGVPVFTVDAHGVLRKTVRGIDPAPAETRESPAGEGAAERSGADAEPASDAGNPPVSAPSPSGEIDGSDSTPEKMFALLHPSDAERAYRLVVREHPQIQAMILASVPTEAARALLLRFPEAVRQGLLERIAKMNVPDSAVRTAVARFLQRMLTANGGPGTAFPDAARTVKAILGENDNDS